MMGKLHLMNFRRGLMRENKFMTERKSIMISVKKIIAIVFNYIPLIIWCVFYSYGANVAFYMIPLQAVIAILNYRFSDGISDMLFLNGNLLLSTLLGIYINSFLYFKYICYDSEGELVRNFELMVGLVYILLITLVMFIIRKNKLRKAKDK